MNRLLKLGYTSEAMALYQRILFQETGVQEDRQFLVAESELVMDGDLVSLFYRLSDNLKRLELAYSDMFASILLQVPTDDVFYLLFTHDFEAKSLITWYGLGDLFRVPEERCSRIVDAVVQLCRMGFVATDRPVGRIHHGLLIVNEEIRQDLYTGNWPDFLAPNLIQAVDTAYRQLPREIWEIRGREHYRLNLQSFLFDFFGSKFADMRSRYRQSDLEACGAAYKRSLVLSIDTCLDRCSEEQINVLVAQAACRDPRRDGRQFLLRLREILYERQ